MIRFAAVIAALLVGLNLSAQENVKVNKVSITSIRPASFSSLSASVTVNVTSSREVTTISQIRGTVYSKDGKAFATGVANDLTVYPGTSDVVISGTGTIANGVGLMGFFRNISFDPANYTADVECYVKTGDGEAHKVEMKGVSVGEMKKFK